jgi:hypothetical protein
VTKTEKRLVKTANEDNAGIVQIKTSHEQRAAAWLHAEGYGIWFPRESPPYFRLHSYVRRTLKLNELRA